jgi:hypothetical protein
MARKIKEKVTFTPGPPKKTSSSGNPAMTKFSSMNKRKKASYKKYRGQGR